jgi:hypothetical protein
MFLLQLIKLNNSKDFVIASVNLFKAKCIYFECCIMMLKFAIVIFGAVLIIAALANVNESPNARFQTITLGHLEK